MKLIEAIAFFSIAAVSGAFGAELPYITAAKVASAACEKQWGNQFPADLQWVGAQMHDKSGNYWLLFAVKPKGGGPWHFRARVLSDTEPDGCARNSALREGQTQ